LREFGLFKEFGLFWEVGNVGVEKEEYDVNCSGGKSFWGYF